MKFLPALIALVSLAHAEVRIESCPERGVQPQVAVDSKGTAHLVYLRGDPAASDVRYSRRTKGAREWTPPITVNSEPASAIAMGTIRGAQIATGPDGRLHVVWNGATKPGVKSEGGALFYTRLLPGAEKFEAQRDLLEGKSGLDGGASVAADLAGAVYAVWHGVGSAHGETGRVVRMRKSTDHGATFGAPVLATGDAAGVCACCSLRALATNDGGIFTLYRAAHTVGQRDMTLLSSRNGGGTFEAGTVGPWAGNTCPMSSAALLVVPGGPRMAWETDGKIFTALAGGAAPLELGKGKHPSLAVNSRGETLAVWTVGTGWNRGGTLEWAVLGLDGKPSGQNGVAPGVPVWSFATAIANEDGDFVIVR